MRAGSYPRREELKGRAGAGSERGGDAAVAGVQEHQAREDDANVFDAGLRLDAGFLLGEGGLIVVTASTMRPHTRVLLIISCVNKRPSAI